MIRIVTEATESKADIQLAQAKDRLKRIIVKYSSGTGQQFIKSLDQVIKSLKLSSESKMDIASALDTLGVSLTKAQTSDLWGLGDKSGFPIPRKIFDAWSYSGDNFEELCAKLKEFYDNNTAFKSMISRCKGGMFEHDACEVVLPSDPRLLEFFKNGTCLNGTIKPMKPKEGMYERLVAFLTSDFDENGNPNEISKLQPSPDVLLGNFRMEVKHDNGQNGSYGGFQLPVGKKDPENFEYFEKGSIVIVFSESLSGDSIRADVLCTASDVNEFCNKVEYGGKTMYQLAPR